MVLHAGRLRPYFQTLHYAEKACQGQTVHVIWPISKLRRKNCEYGARGCIHNTSYSS